MDGVPNYGAIAAAAAATIAAAAAIAGHRITFGSAYLLQNAYF